MEKTVILKSKFIFWYSKNEIGVPCNKMTYFTMKHEEKQLKKTQQRQTNEVTWRGEETGEECPVKLSSSSYTRTSIFDLIMSFSKM